MGFVRFSARKVALSCAAAGLACLSAPRTARAGGGAATDAYEDIREDVPIDTHLLADLYFQHIVEGSDRGAALYRPFELRNDIPSVSLLRLTLAHRPDTLGFRLDAGVGDTADAYRDSDPASTRYPTSSRWLSYVQQAYVTAVLPAGRGVAIDVGKFGTPVGLEDNETRKNWNYSRGLLFTLAEPTYHTGIRATAAVTDELAVSAFWLNGWNTNLLAGNGMRSGAVALSWRSPGDWDASLVYATGLERPQSRLWEETLGFRHELDLSAVHTLTPHLSLAATMDYGIDDARRGGSWWGIGGYARWRPLDWLAVNSRGEHFADTDGFITGVAQRLVEATLTLEITKHVGRVTLVGRAEVRRDQSDVRVFRAAGEQGLTHQDTITVGLAAWL
jgi:Putative beta-barrel porin-2, OmpL-like. bbp2